MAEDADDYEKTMVLARPPHQDREAPPTAALTCLNPEVLQDPGGASIPLRYGEVTLGRGPENVVPILAESVSKTHARVSPRGGEWFIVDQDSANGVRVNQTRITAETPLRPGDLVEIGAVRYRYDLAAEAGDETGAAAEDVTKTIILRPQHQPAAKPQPPPRTAPAPPAPPPSTPGAATETPAPGSSRWPMVVIAGTVAVVAVAALVWLLL